MLLCHAINNEPVQHDVSTSLQRHYEATGEDRTLPKLSASLRMYYFSALSKLLTVVVCLPSVIAFSDLSLNYSLIHVYDNGKIHQGYLQPGKYNPQTYTVRRVVNHQYTWIKFGVLSHSYVKVRQQCICDIHIEVPQIISIKSAFVLQAPKFLIWEIIYFGKIIYQNILWTCKLLAFCHYIFCAFPTFFLFHCLIDRKWFYKFII